MGIIKFIWNLFKARFGTFTDEEFEALCKEYSRYGGGLFDKHVKPTKLFLSIFFAHNVPTSRQLTILYDCSGNDLKWLYLSKISKKRLLTADEQMRMASDMPFDSVYRCPQRLCDEAVVCLFAGNDTDTDSLVSYVRDFELPERYELELIERYSTQKASQEADFDHDYRYVLNEYLSSLAHKKCRTLRVQKRLLEVGDEELLMGLCNSQSLAENALFSEIMRSLAELGYERAFDALLHNSFIADRKLQSKVYSAFPKLRWKLEISKVRRALYVLEKKNEQQWFVDAPSMKELEIIQTGEVTNDQLVFIAHMVLPRLKDDTATPYFCAWAADEYPHLGESAYKCIRRFAQKYLAASRCKTEC